MKGIIELDLVDCVNLVPTVRVMLEMLDDDDPEGPDIEGLKNLFDRLEAAVAAEITRRDGAGFSIDEVERLGLIERLEAVAS